MFTPRVGSLAIRLNCDARVIAEFGGVVLLVFLGGCIRVFLGNESLGGKTDG